MQQDFLIDQKVPNEATGELGYNWADMIQIPHNASIEEIQEIQNNL
jgi:hypothetical protein